MTNSLNQTIYLFLKWKEKLCMESNNFSVFRYIVFFTPDSKWCQDEWIEFTILGNGWSTCCTIQVEPTDWWRVARVDILQRLISKWASGVEADWHQEWKRRAEPRHTSSQKDRQGTCKNTGEGVKIRGALCYTHVYPHFLLFLLCKEESQTCVLAPSSFRRFSRPSSPPGAIKKLEKIKGNTSKEWGRAQVCVGET